MLMWLKFTLFPKKKQTNKHDKRICFVSLHFDCFIFIFFVRSIPLIVARDEKLRKKKKYVKSSNQFNDSYPQQKKK